MFMVGSVPHWKSTVDVGTERIDGAVQGRAAAGHAIAAVVVTTGGLPVLKLTILPYQKACCCRCPQPTIPIVVSRGVGRPNLSVAERLAI